MDTHIAIILTSIERPQALKKSIESILAVWQDNRVLLIGDQNPIGSKSYQIIDEFIINNPDKDIRTFNLEYNCGISVARNELIHFANLIGCEYVLLTADSILFNDSMKDIPNLFSCFQKSDRQEWDFYDLIGLSLQGRIQWEAKLELIPNQSFQLNFIEKKLKDDIWLVGDKTFNIWPCDIVRNFWMARTKALIRVPYDEQLIMIEHEDWFWRVKQEGLKIGCTNLVNGLYEKEQNTPEYDKIRTNNFRIGKQRLLDKYSLKNWVSYKNLERIHQ
jgi:hypothetical protein